MVVRAEEHNSLTKNGKTFANSNRLELGLKALPSRGKAIFAIGCVLAHQPRPDEKSKRNRNFEMPSSSVHRPGLNGGAREGGKKD